MAIGLTMPGAISYWRSNNVKSAERIARRAHAGQVDIVGNDYIRHVERVVERVDAEDAKAVAWLHDVIEDTKVKEHDLREEGISEVVLAAVNLLTRKEGD